VALAAGFQELDHSGVEPQVDRLPWGGA
jgi:hypothetical protein